MMTIKSRPVFTIKWLELNDRLEIKLSRSNQPLSRKSILLFFYQDPFQIDTFQLVAQEAILWKRHIGSHFL